LLVNLMKNRVDKTQLKRGLALPAYCLRLLTEK
jgi:hypothetical protein